MGESTSQTYAYDAQTSGGEAVRGTIEAAGHDEAQGRLEHDLGLRVVGLSVAEDRDPPRRIGTLRGEELLAFNQQLAQLTASGLPVEQGLRLIARDMRRGRLARGAEAVADELDRGASLSEAFDRHRGTFPVLYAEVVEAGVRLSNLPSVLFNLGRHLELLQRLRATLWQAGAYPAVVLALLAAVMVFLGMWIAPQFREIFADFATELPFITKWVLTLATWTPWILGFLALVVGLVIVAQIAAWSAGRPALLAETLVLPLPLVGTMLQRNLTARWCDAVRLGVDSGMDLPESIDMAGRALATGKLSADSRTLIETLQAGRSLDEVRGLRILPASVPSVMAMGQQQSGLGSLLGQLASMYQEQAELKLRSIQAALTPVFVLFLAVTLGTVITALFLPLVKLMQSVM